MADTLNLARAFAALHRAGIHDLTLADINGDHLNIRVYDPAQSTAVLAALDNPRPVRLYEPLQIATWHGTVGAVTVRLILGKKATAA